jgi:hypothetical protein
MTTAWFYGQKLASGLVFLVAFPVMNIVGVHPFGVGPVHIWLAGFAVGFDLPDRMIEKRLERRRTTLLMELPTVPDLPAVSASAGTSPEQALLDVSRQAGASLRQAQGEPSHPGADVSPHLAASSGQKPPRWGHSRKFMALHPLLRLLTQPLHRFRSQRFGMTCEQAN